MATLEIPSQYFGELTEPQRRCSCDKNSFTTTFVRPLDARSIRPNLLLLTGSEPSNADANENDFNELIMPRTVFFLRYFSYCISRTFEILRGMLRCVTWHQQRPRLTHENEMSKASTFYFSGLQRRRISFFVQSRELDKQKTKLQVPQWMILWAMRTIWMWRAGISQEKSNSTRELLFSAIHIPAEITDSFLASSFL